MSSAADDWGNIFNTLISSNWSKLEPTALQNFSKSPTHAANANCCLVTSKGAQAWFSLLRQGVPCTCSKFRACSKSLGMVEQLILYISIFAWRGGDRKTSACHTPINAQTFDPVCIFMLDTVML